MGCLSLQEESFFQFPDNNNDPNKKKKGERLKKAVLVLLLVLGAAIGFAQETADSVCLKVKVRPTIDNKTAMGVTVKLYRDSQELVHIDSTDEKQVVFLLQKDSHYTIEIASPGRVTRRVSFFTSLPEDVPSSPVFRYNMDVELPAHTPSVNAFYADFPVALIEYDENKDRFDYSRKYTAHIKARMQEMDAEPSIVNK
jgi:hypothetical protein